jgi:hypothetical protein
MNLVFFYLTLVEEGKKSDESFQTLPSLVFRTNLNMFTDSSV